MITPNAMIRPGKKIEQDIPDNLTAFQKKSQVTIEGGQEKLPAKYQHRDEHEPKHTAKSPEFSFGQRDDFTLQEIENLDLAGRIENHKENRQRSGQSIGSRKTTFG